MKNNESNSSNNENEKADTFLFLEIGCNCGCSKMILREKLTELCETFQALSSTRLSKIYFNGPAESNGWRRNNCQSTS